MAKREMITPPNNSFKQKAKEAAATEEKREMRPGSVMESRKSAVKKLTEIFISEDAESVKSYIFFDVIIPMAKDLFSSAIKEATDMIFYGRSGGSSYKGRSSSKYGSASYQSYYNGGRQKSYSNDQPTRGTSEITFDTRKLAWDVLEEMRAVVEQYDNLSILDYHDIVEKITGFVPAGSHTDAKYGWTDLSGVEVRMVRGGRYILTLPKAVLLD